MNLSTSFTNKEELAALLNGREYRDEISRSEEARAKELGLVVVFGASDDLMEFRGAIRDEVGAGADEDETLIDTKGEIGAWEDARENLDTEEEVKEWFERKRNAIKVTSYFGENDEYSFTFSTPLPFATFDIMEGDEKYCRGIVFELPKP